MMAGQVLAGRYELGDRLGVGGMSTVVRAFDTRLERDVAVKLLAEHLADDSQFVARFRREALSVARLVHPNIVQVFDFGLDEATHRQYIVMELVRGQSGAEILRDEGSLDVRDALSIVVQALRGLEYAHRNGVVHRDVKPGNLLRGEDGVVKLADFGIAKAFSEESSITQVGSVLGTAAYLAPEQAAGEQAGPAADLYALGVVAYQFLSGRLPYEAQSLTELALKQQRELPPRLDELNPEVSPAARDGRRPRARARPAPAARQRRRAAPPAGRRRARRRARPVDDPRRRPGDERHQRRRTAARRRHRRGARPGPAAPAARVRAPPRPAPTSATIAPPAARRAAQRQRTALLRHRARAPAAGRRRRRGRRRDLELRPGREAAPGRLRRRPAGRRQPSSSSSTTTRSSARGRYGAAPARSASASAASVPAPIASRRRRTTRSTKARLCSVNRRMPVSSRAWAR